MSTDVVEGDPDARSGRGGRSEHEGFWLVPRLRALVLALLVGTAASAARADADRGLGQPIDPGVRTIAPAEPDPALESLEEGATGDWFGVRSMLSERGIEFEGGYAFEVLGNVRGGIERGAAPAGLLELALTADLERSIGWPGASLRASGFHLVGDDASVDLVGSLFTVSNIAGPSGWRLYEAWLDQSLFDGLVSIRAGQLAADAEFAASEHAGLFLDATFGWPAFLYANLPAGAPCFPMGTLGARLAIHPADWLTVDGAVLQGDPLFQDADSNGFEWDGDEDAGIFFVNEIHASWNGGEGPDALAGRAGVGVWTHFFDVPNADPLSDDTYPRNYGVYVVLDQSLWLESGDGGSPGSHAGAPQGLAGFVRVAGSPSDRSVIALYGDAGLVYRGLLPGRDEDVVGIAFAYGGVTRGARSAIELEGLDPANAEILVEATYEARLLPWLAIQPDLQVVIDPGATTSVDPAVVVGARLSVAF